MSVEVKVNRVRENGLFYGGDEVSGIVEVRGPLDFPEYNDTKVQITFTGSCEVSHTLKNVYHDKAVFFEAERVLYEGKVELKTGASQTWQFSFILPKQTEPDGGQAQIKRKKRVEVFLMSPHPLPQSAALQGSTPHPWAALVSYILYAKILGKKWGWREHRVAITVVPKALPSDANPFAELALQSKEFSYASSRLLPEEAERKRSINKWLGDKLSSATPKAVFTIKAQTAQILTPGQPIPILLQLNFNTQKSNLASLPELRLLDVKYEILAKTQIWGDCFMASPAARELTGRLARPTPVLTQHMIFDSPGHFLVNGQNIKVDRWKADDGNEYQITFNKALVPPFRTYNFVRTYEAAVSIKFDCGGKQIKADFKWPLDIVFNEHYIPPITMVTKEDDREAIIDVGKNIVKGIVIIVTSALT